MHDNYYKTNMIYNLHNLKLGLPRHAFNLNVDVTCVPVCCMSKKVKFTQLTPLLTKAINIVSNMEKNLV